MPKSTKKSDSCKSVNKSDTCKSTKKSVTKKDNKSSGNSTTKKKTKKVPELTENLQTSENPHLPQESEPSSQVTELPEESEEFDLESNVNPIVVYEQMSKEEKTAYTRRISEDIRRNGILRLRKFNNPIELHNKITEYFDKCDKAKPKIPYTMPDLAHYLGFNNKNAVREYSRKKDDCGKVMKAALLKIEGQRNQQLVTGQGQNAGRIFDLKCNFGWNEHGTDLTEKDQDNGEKGSKSIHFHGLPPTPKTMSEWMDMVKDYEKKKAKTDQSQVESPGQAPGNSHNT